MPNLEVIDNIYEVILKKLATFNRESFDETSVVYRRHGKHVIISSGNERLSPSFMSSHKGKWSDDVSITSTG